MHGASPWSADDIKDRMVVDAETSAFVRQTRTDFTVARQTDKVHSLTAGSRQLFGGQTMAYQDTAASASALTTTTSIPNGPQNVTIVDGNNLTQQVQAPPNASGSIWFAFSPQGQAVLNVNFNGQNYPNVPPGQYQLNNLTTNLGLSITATSGAVKVAWINS
jgi:hypothetical protein